MRIILDKKSNVYAPILLVVCCLASTSQGEPTTCSSDVWFGSKCHFRCRCDPPNSGCDQVTGHCPHKCLSGWFGPGCQYRMATSGLPAWATDGDPGTCNSNASRVLTARFLPPIRLAWLVLSASSEEKLKATSVQYFEQGGPTAYCRRNTLVSAPNSFGEVYTTQVSCSARSFVSSIVIIGDGTDYLCSIEISLGETHTQLL
ncbi:hypothetical protein RRG08_007052 [Elysia crispata]|uniref:Uncharacterized protein n=1 Tax=Elysia crispata TaxID=231223 RepID=A0AAE0ZJZ0_9GAST|nr:hypothetical protein RRG08_007052 [Elysia crispata]